jgi:hypothetical protein
MYRIIDCQGMGTMESRVFKTKADIVEALANYHSVDFSGSLAYDEDRDIYEYLEQFKTTQEKLDYLLDYGDWEIETIERSIR